MPSTKSLIIVLVEDDDGHAALVQMNLRNAGLDNTIIHLTDGRLAIDYVQQVTRKEPPEAMIILLDLNLPEIDGYGVISHLKNDPSTYKIPIIVLTSTDDPREINRCYELGCNLFIRKPVDYTKFIFAIKQLGFFLSVVELPSAADYSEMS